ncbi:WD repeat-containing protein 18 [Amphibalanus amphitrite]|uniref:WD repeat-containing protein 18 n=1 Tax=Amphibalanus amphitrite TaxID=1232801 RepID=A0A6A4VUV3_AMPAM|nr:WD repeat-containing protein 18 [Amphibalanus amphitrite]
MTPILPMILDVLGRCHFHPPSCGRPGVQLWRLARRDAVHQRLSTPGPVTALAADPAATWLALAVAERVFVHELSSGRLLAVLSRHYQTVTALRFTDDGSHFVSAADDGLAAVWPVAGCADPESARHGQPLHVWAHHSLPITGLHVGGGGPRARVLTCSRDQTCKVYQLSSGELLLSVSFDVGLTSVALGPAETPASVCARCRSAAPSPTWRWSGGRPRCETPAPRRQPLHVGQLQRAQPDSGPLELELVLRDRPALLESPADGEDADGEGDGGRADRDDTIEQLRRQIAACEDVNASMYQFMVDKVMKV